MPTELLQAYVLFSLYANHVAYFSAAYAPQRQIAYEWPQISLLSLLMPVRTDGLIIFLCNNLFLQLSNALFSPSTGQYATYHIFWLCVCSLRYPACKPVRLYYIFPHYRIKGSIFEEKRVIEQNMFWFSLQLLSETFFILRRIWRNMIRNVDRSSCKVLLFWSHLNEILIFSTDLKKNTEISNTTKIRLVVAEVFHAGGRTDRHDKANSRFSQFCERYRRHMTCYKVLNEFLSRLLVTLCDKEVPR